VKIDPQLLRVGAPVFGPVKGKNNRPRIILLPDFVVEEMSAHVSRYNLGADGLQFSGTNSGPLPRSTFSGMWRAAAEPLGIANGDGFHLLRRLKASLLIESGQFVKSVQEGLGDRSAVITLDVYGHPWPEGENLTRPAVDNAFAKLRGHGAHAQARPSKVPVQKAGDGESACRRDSVQPLRALVTIHLSGLPGDAPPSRSGRAARFPRLALLRVGFTKPIRLP
jgi:hypothetical protein